MQDYRVLVIGPRRGLIAQLRERRIPFSVWQQRANFRVAATQLNLVAPLWSSPAKVRAQIRDAFPDERFTHVIAGTESAVLPAALARREVGARSSSVASASRCRDKLLMKQHLAKFAIPMTPYLADSAELEPARVFADLGAPLVRKFRKSSGGRGMQLLARSEDYQPGKRGVCILERYVDAPEASIESFIDHGKIRFSNITQYYRKGHSNFVPAQFGASLQSSLLELNAQVISALGIAWGMTHLEVYLTSGGPLFGEIALRPPGGYIMNALHHAWGFKPWAAFLAMELGEEFVFPASVSAYAAAEVLHPGSGRVLAVKGEAQVLDEQGVCELRVKVRLGDLLAPRSALGQDTGYVIHASSSPEQRLALHERIEANLRIEMEALV